ncbi:MAG: methyltransferase domain-containing protein, partial [Planctomycetota bacterium]
MCAATAMKAGVVPKLARLGKLVTGHRGGVSAPGVRFIERDTRPVGAGLSKSYDVVFDAAPAMRVTLTLERPYADIVGRGAFEFYEAIASAVRPGARLLDAKCSTGFGAWTLAKLVGASGAVVAIDTDHECVRFARRRYGRSGGASDGPSEGRELNLGIELGSPEPGKSALAGELDGSFDAVVAVDAVSMASGEATTRELWRVVAPGGWLLVGSRLGALKPDVVE